MVVVPVPPSEATRATSSDPSGGVNDAVLTVVADVVLANAGPDGSSARVPAVRISAIASGPPDCAGVIVYPSVVAPGVPVRDVALNVTYRSPLTASLTSSVTVVSAAAEEVSVF